MNTDELRKLAAEFIEVEKEYLLASEDRHDTITRCLSTSKGLAAAMLENNIEAVVIDGVVIVRDGNLSFVVPAVILD